ncbi:hypothetical protein KFE98_18040 [bacterium SCSIO 12741]|nr:hypothetical protein KFE98_18040 [bacterium SCSIO 12741]
MKKILYTSLAGLLLGILMASCGPERTVEWAMYHWKSEADFSKEEQAFLADQSVNKVYIRYFDVVKKGGRLIPVSVLQSADTLPAQNWIPSIYITQQSLIKISSVEIDELADNMTGKIHQLNNRFGIQSPEILLDCDWTDGTRDAYFNLLRKIKEKSGSQLISTVRLHQLKHFEDRGVPPVDRCQLMLYNMGYLSDYKERNSILNVEEAGKYRRKLDEYPKPMDLSLPMFSWLVRFRSGKSQELISDFDREVLQDTSLFSNEGGNKYMLKRDTFLFDRFQYKYDVYRLEECSHSDLIKLARQWEPMLPSGPIEIAWFDLRSRNLNNRKETWNEIEQILN